MKNSYLFGRYREVGRLHPPKILTRRLLITFFGGTTLSRFIPDADCDVLCDACASSFLTLIIH
jgi:hypothetical protein